MDCFQTIAISSTEEELLRTEDHHVCIRRPRDSRGKGLRDGSVNRKESLFDVRG
jgi:hypothetical protein